jgi:purine-binding chemotaxis protein CheW
MQLIKEAATFAQDDLRRQMDSGDTQQFITFRIGAEEYGIDIMVVREIKGWTETTMIPNAPAHVRGVINLRGVVVPIFDLRARFGIPLINQSPPLCPPQNRCRIDADGQEVGACGRSCRG